LRWWFLAATIDLETVGLVERFQQLGELLQRLCRVGRQLRHALLRLLGVGQGMVDLAAEQIECHAVPWIAS
jgi:hypothetical protein